MIPFVEAKRPSYDRIQELLAASETLGIWSNFGPVSLRLESTISAVLRLPENLQVVACASGTTALRALIHLREHLHGGSLRWVVSAFTFAAQRQGPLAQAQVLDCDPQGLLDLERLAALRQESYDGIVVTNLFGTARQLRAYEELATRLGKILLFDSATCFGTTHQGQPLGRFGDGEIFSFHHTKPCGFGEGGCAVIPTEHVATFRSLINFGLYKGIDTGWRSGNGKMSDVAAAFILDRLRLYDELRAAHRQQFERVATVARGLGLAALTEGESEGAFPNLVPILFPRAVASERLRDLPLVLHKYYPPLAPLPRATELFGRLVCFPCHAAVAGLTDGVLRAVMRGLAG